MKKTTNYFAQALTDLGDSEDEPQQPHKFAFGPSVLAGDAGRRADASPLAAAAGALPLEGAGAPLSFAAMAQELRDTTAGLPTKAEAAWDLTALSASAGEAAAAAAAAAAAEAAALSMEAHLSRQHSREAAELQAAMARSGVSHRQRSRRNEAAARAEEASDRLMGKVYKKQAARKRWNAAKSAWS